MRVSRPLAAGNFFDCFQQCHKLSKSYSTFVSFKGEGSTLRHHFHYQHTGSCSEADKTASRGRQSRQRSSERSKRRFVMLYDLIATFYENVNDGKPRYTVPINNITVCDEEELFAMGFMADPDSTPGFRDYLKEVTEEELEEYADAECGCEIIPILDGMEYDRIIIHAYECEFIGMTGEPAPRAIFSDDVRIDFFGQRDDDPVSFSCGDSHFSRPLGNLKIRYGVLTMFELMDIVRDFCEKEKPDYGRLVRKFSGTPVTIYRDDEPTSREIWIESDGDSVRMIQQDLGQACELMNGDDEYEREVACDLGDLEEKLGAEGAAEVLSRLAEAFRTADSIDLFEEFLQNLGIEFEYFSY